jgi:hypothetical protein
MNPTAIPVPEPSTWAMIGAAAVAFLSIVAWKRMKGRTKPPAA